MKKNHRATSVKQNKRNQLTFRKSHVKISLVILPRTSPASKQVKKCNLYELLTHLWQWRIIITLYIPLTNRVRGPYRKLLTEFFPPRFMAQARNARAINRRGKNEDP